MKSWSAPSVPSLPGTAPMLRLRDEHTGELAPLETDGTATVYVCGITPYDATHLGHAATYHTFDLVHRVLRDAGQQVTYVQNVTDIDDPLIERAQRDGVDWRELATSEIELFHDDMTALRIIPPDHYVGVVETMPRHVATIERLVELGVAYALPVEEREAGAGGIRDWYLDLATQPRFGEISGWTREQMMDVFAERGGDPDRPGKRDRLDPLLWRGRRVGEPFWDGASLGEGRPGWHLECTTIALDHLGMGFTLQGGGTDLIFPHHEMSAVQGEAVTGSSPFARSYAHQAMVAYDGEKMSKSKGNLVKVSQLLRDGVDPRAIRLVLLDQHYAQPWEYTTELLREAEKRWGTWRSALDGAGDAGADDLLAGVREALARDLDSPAAIGLVDSWAREYADAGAGPSPKVADLLDALLGLR
ncbi:cysteine--1-D-myo-inosityl 2-amino-2-deoxy-alpha-D-glucopyranoside ligase [Calidifontibacter sp. DB0510]|uniref:L-cysteine:1D-myo-inositol 2-amino-2-deoxy-alpha-D-glucopyranoside ligase n=1 Tax=Metallococcus carri TaxID=1656884 RepID=A0A967E844_9MICO|nr:cysteine--1-D-myo-inosityl 2-amino-2-deoxy-alpha-D-glucopyranoside ligase [Metallococcus carri]NHN54827.1 cysteine--1-D-myo-inosityl 2-amino-2-deoxy-alpha-D-glucopyranoside ligase [Metallococcus carri]NOP37172.1 cysteine--1-D-myo-inosityl 2-amino-2-deoxy-alpha-D-glucopyranoside ligase [Calidifontibacter sp. DB2511S]